VAEPARRPGEKINVFSKLRQALKLYHLFGRCKDALKAGLETPTMSKTKLGAALAGLGTLILLAAQVLNGQMDFATAIPAAITAIGAVIAVFGGRNAVQKIIDK